MTIRRLLLAMCALASSLAHAGNTDCEPLDHLSDYASNAQGDRGGKPELQAFGEHDFPLADGAMQTVQGQVCIQTYFLAAGIEEPAPDMIAQHYRAAFQKLGASPRMADACTNTAMFRQNGAETWMHVNCAQGFAGSYTVTVVRTTAMKLSLTPPAADDYRLLGHMPGYVVVKGEKADAGELSFPIGGGVYAKVQGRRQHIDYEPKPGAVRAADLEIVQNYLAAMQAAGGELVYQDKSDLTARMPEGDHQVWVHVVALFGNVTLDVVDEKPFVVVAQPPRSDALKAELDGQGHVALYVNFDFAKATLRPDAAPVIAQVVALLKANPSYAVGIEGHTDNVGDDAANQKLSEARAAAVVDAVVKGGIDRSRLAASGHGEANPIADNATSEGRAKNRRVELVKR